MPKGKQSPNSESGYEICEGSVAGFIVNLVFQDGTVIQRKEPVMMPELFEGSFFGEIRKPVRPCFFDHRNPLLSNRTDSRPGDEARSRVYAQVVSFHLQVQKPGVRA